MSNNDYKINFKSLSDGEHKFEFKITPLFFEQFEESIPTSGSLDLIVSMLKKSHLIELDFFIDGTIEVACDRCLDPIELPIVCNEKLFVKFSEEASDISDVDDVLYLAFNDYEIELQQHIYEYICLRIPYKNIHPEDEEGNSLCNAEMLEKMEEFVVEEEEQPETDPRWDELKGLLN